MEPWNKSMYTYVVSIQHWLLRWSLGNHGDLLQKNLKSEVLFRYVALQQNMLSYHLIVPWVLNTETINIHCWNTFRVGFHALFVGHQDSYQLPASTYGISDNHNTTFFMACYCKSPASRLFTLPFGQAQIKETQKICHCPLWGEFTSERWFLRTKGL